MRKFFPGAGILPGSIPAALDEHMAFQHGFTRVHQDNANAGVAQSYYRVVDESIEIGERTFRFRDYVEFKNGKLKVHEPSGIYPSNDEIKTANIVKATISF